MSETAKTPENNVINLDRYKEEHLGLVQQQVEKATGEKVDTVQSPHDQEIILPEGIIQFVPQRIEEAFGEEVGKVDGVTDPAGTGFKGWLGGYFRGRPRISGKPTNFMKAKVSMAEAHGQQLGSNIKKAA